MGDGDEEDPRNLKLGSKIVIGRKPGGSWQCEVLFQRPLGGLECSFDPTLGYGVCLPADVHRFVLQRPPYPRHDLVEPDAGLPGMPASTEWIVTPVVEHSRVGLR